MPDTSKPRAYIAQRYTGLDEASLSRDQEISVVLAKVLSDNSFVAHLSWAKDYDPPRASRESNIVYMSERERLIESDLLVALHTGPSTGIGRELEIADQYLIETIHVRVEGMPASRMASGHSQFVPHEVTFRTEGELRERLSELLVALRPTLQWRRIKWPPKNVPPLCAKRVQAARTKQGMSRDFLARKLGINRRYIADIEEGKTVPSLYALRVLAEGLGYPSAASLQGTDLEDDSKRQESVPVFEFFVRHKLGMHQFLPFCEAYENSAPASNSQPSDEDLWTIYTALFGPPESHLRQL